MPELPEVETVMRAMALRLQGRTLQGAAVHRADLRWPFPPDLAGRLTGRRVTGFRRRAKYILMRVEGGQSVLIHLGMSGRMMMGRDTEAAPVRHEHMTLVTDDGWRVSFIDPRRFGSVDLVATEAEDLHPRLRDLGIEPLEAGLTPAALSLALTGRRTPIKPALLDQGVVAGLGNIYVSEALFRARISPQRIASSVAGVRARRLVPAIGQVLGEAIAAGGSSLRDYVQPDGELGYFQHAWKVYGRHEQPCEVCPGKPGCAGIKRIVQAGRATYFCPRVQR